MKVVRALLRYETDLRAANEALGKLETFGQENRFAQYRRSPQLLAAALQAGLADDPKWGQQVQTAREQIEALKDQHRVLDEWNSAYKTYRQDVLDAFKAVYVPLRADLHRRVTTARAAITGMTEYRQLRVGDAALVRTEFLGEGKPLAEVALPELHDEQQLLNANTFYSIAHMRSALAALDSEVSRAQARVIELYTREQIEKGEQARLATWEPAKAFAGKRFTTEDEVDTVFDAEKERVKTLLREGKTVQVV